MNEAAVLEKLRKICLSFPDAKETSSWGHPNFRTTKKTFAALDEYGGKKYIAFIGPPPLLDHLDGKPHFKRSGHKTWMMRDLEKIDWKEMQSLLAQAHAIASPDSGKKELEQMIAAYDPDVAKKAKAILKKMRERLPGAVELVYDNYNALAIAFSANDRLDGVIFSIALYPRWVNLFFAHGASLEDPKKLLQGSGKAIRHITLDDPKKLDEPAVKSLMKAAIGLAEIPIDPGQKNRIVIKSSSPKKRSRRPK